MSRQSLSKAHAKITELSWEPTFATPATRFGTDYTFEKAPKKDPLKQIMRSYFPMEEEKDNRVYGALDAALRGDMFRNVEPRWVEWMKLFLAIIPFPEISAARSMSMLARLAPGSYWRVLGPLMAAGQRRSVRGRGPRALRGDRRRDGPRRAARAARGGGLRYSARRGAEGEGGAEGVGPAS